MRVNTLSKLTYGDTRQFLALIGDVFPGAESSDIPGVREHREESLQQITRRMTADIKTEHPNRNNYLFHIWLNISTNFK